MSNERANWKEELPIFWKCIMRTDLYYWPILFQYLKRYANRRTMRAAKKDQLSQQQPRIAVTSSVGGTLSTIGEWQYVLYEYTYSSKDYYKTSSIS